MLPRLLTCSYVRSELRLEAEKSTVGLFGRWIARAAAVVGQELWGELVAELNRANIDPRSKVADVDTGLEYEAQDLFRRERT